MKNITMDDIKSGKIECSEFKFWIKLDSTTDIKDFCEAASKTAADISIISGKYIVDGKSILGVLSLDLTHPVKVCVYNPKKDNFFKDVEKFVYKEEDNE